MEASRAAPGGMACRADTRPSAGAKLRAFYELGKPNLSALVVVTAVLGYAMASRAAGQPIALVPLLYLVIGTAMTSMGACALNMYLERELDASMVRTRKRPLPARRLSPEEALFFALFTFVWGFAQLAVFSGALVAGLSLFTAVIYAYVYTPLKRRGPVSVWVGAVPGAIPPLMGWAAVTGGLEAPAFALFAVLFAWQFPHFLALAYVYRQDYLRVGFQFLPRSERLTGLSIAIGAVVVLGVSLVPYALGVVSSVYLAGALVFGLVFVASALPNMVQLTARRARRTFIASIVYLPLLLLLLGLDGVFLS